MKKVIKSLVIILMISAVLMSLTSCLEEGKKATKITENSREEIITTKKAEEKKDERAKIGETLQASKWKMTFLGAKTYKTTPNDNEYLRTTADDGKVFIFVFIEVENISDKSDSVSSFGSAGYVDGYKTSSTYIMSDVDGYEELSGTVEPNRKAKGFFAFEIDENWQEFEMVYTDGILSTSDKYTFVVTKEEIK